MTRTFKEAREAANCYAGWKEEEMPASTRCERCRCICTRKKIAGHASEGMTKNYQRDHDEIIWSEAIPDLNISEIAG